MNGNVPFDRLRVNGEKICLSIIDFRVKQVWRAAAHYLKSNPESSDDDLFSNLKYSGVPYSGTGISLRGQNRTPRKICQEKKSEISEKVEILVSSRFGGMAEVEIWIKLGRF